MPCLYAISGAGPRAVVMGKGVVAGVACWVVAYIKGSLYYDLKENRPPAYASWLTSARAR